MAKIPKNRSDKEMFVNYKEQLTFENDILAEAAPAAARTVKVEKKEKNSLNSEFFTPELQEKVGKALLEVKLELFKTGVVDFDIKVTRRGTEVVLTAAPRKVKGQ